MAEVIKGKLIIELVDIFNMVMKKIKIKIYINKLLLIIRFKLQENVREDVKEIIEECVGEIYIFVIKINNKSYNKELTVQKGF